MRMHISSIASALLATTVGCSSQSDQRERTNKLAQAVNPACQGSPGIEAFLIQQDEPATWGFFGACFNEGDQIDVWVVDDLSNTQVGDDMIVTAQAYSGVFPGTVSGTFSACMTSTGEIHAIDITNWTDRADNTFDASLSCRPASCGPNAGEVCGHRGDGMGGPRCCAQGDVCTTDACCASEVVCGILCLPAGSSCCSDGANPVTCGPGKACCPTVGGPCCPSGTSCQYSPLGDYCL
jgi:hypothetical protein